MLLNSSGKYCVPHLSAIDDVSLHSAIASTALIELSDHGPNFSWIISKLVPAQSRIKETLQFLLDHPRRCFIYLFPAHQTWYLVFVLFVLNGIDWASFLILDIGTPSIEAIPLNVRVIDGLFQSFAVRAAGFSIGGSTLIVSSS